MPKGILSSIHSLILQYRDEIETTDTIYRGRCRWMSQQQQEVIAYLCEENKILREKLGRKRILLSIEQKRRLATKGKMIGWELLARFGPLFFPDTILAWHRKLIARKYDGSANRRPGPPPTKGL